MFLLDVSELYTCFLLSMHCRHVWCSSRCAGAPKDSAGQAVLQGCSRTPQRTRQHAAAAASLLDSHFTCEYAIHTVAAAGI